MGDSNDLTLTLTLSGHDYIIVKVIDDDGDVEYYTIRDEDGNVIYLYVNDNYKTTGMAIDLADDDPDDEEIPLGVNTDGELGIVEGAKILMTATFMTTLWTCMKMFARMCSTSITTTSATICATPSLRIWCLRTPSSRQWTLSPGPRM
jgi:hypothetical protein